MNHTICNLLNETEVQVKTENLSNTEKKDFIKSLELIHHIEIGRDITYIPINDFMISTIDNICKEKEDYEILQILKDKIERINKIKINSIVEFAGSSYTVVNLNHEKMEIDIKQNFSIGLIYKKMGIFEVKFLK